MTEEIKITKVNNYFVSALYLNGVLYTMGQDVSKKLEELLLSYNDHNIKFEVIYLDDEQIQIVMAKFISTYPKNLIDLQNEIATTN